jgi:hypothetical protein
MIVDAISKFAPAHLAGEGQLAVRLCPASTTLRLLNANGAGQLNNLGMQLVGVYPRQRIWGASFFGYPSSSGNCGPWDRVSAHGGERRKSDAR